MRGAPVPPGGGGRVTGAVAQQSQSSDLTRLQRFFTQLLERDPGGRSWLGRLLAAAPHGRQRLRELVDQPGYLTASTAVRGVGGRLACFDFIAGPPRELLEWFVAHPDQLSWVEGAELSPEALLLRRALLHDEPTGARARAQERARELMEVRSALAREWWRFEEVRRLECVLMTDRLVLTVGGESNPLVPVTPWYPPRLELVRVLEAARGLAGEEKRWASLILSDSIDDPDVEDALAGGLRAAAPHLDEADRTELAGAFLGVLSWDAARAAVG